MLYIYFTKLIKMLMSYKEGSQSIQSDPSLLVGKQIKEKRYAVNGHRIA